MGRVGRRPAPALAAPPAHRRRRSRRARFGHYLRGAAINGRLPALLLCVGLSVLTVGFLVSDDFTVRTVVVEGNNVAYAEAIVASSGALGAPIFQLNTSEIAERVVAHPAVETAEVSLVFPDRVIVRVRERLPVLVWQVGDRAVLVNAYGWVIAEGYDEQLFRVVQIEGALPEPGSKLAAELIQAIGFLAGELGGELEALEYHPALGLTAHLRDGRSVVLGDSQRMPLKLSVLRAVRSLGEQWTRLDVREPDRPYYQ